MNKFLLDLKRYLAVLSGNMLLGLFMISASHAADVTTQSLTLSDAWVRSSVPGQVNGAGYIKIQNKGSQADRLLSATSTVANTVELHTVITENGIAKMREINGLDIPAEKTVSMAPGGYHVMFLQLKAPFKEGSLIPVTLKFEKAGDVKVDFIAKPAAFNPGSPAGLTPAAHNHEQHNHAEHNHAQHNHDQHGTHHQQAAKQLDPLFINLTTDEPSRAGMALGIAQHHSANGRPITIFLSDKGIQIGLKASNDKFPEQQLLLKMIMDKGGVVVVCPPCLKHFGKTEADLMSGIKMGGPQVTSELLFKEGTKTLSW